MATSNRILLKLRPSDALAAAASRANLHPLFEPAFPLPVTGAAEPQIFRGGSTLVVDLKKPAIEYNITKNINSETRQQRTAAFLQDALADPLRAQLLVPDRQEPFAALHSLADIG